MRVKYLAQEHNAVPRRGLEPGPPDPESSALTIRPPRLPQTRCRLLPYCSTLTVPHWKGEILVAFVEGCVHLWHSDRQVKHVVREWDNLTPFSFIPSTQKWNCSPANSRTHGCSSLAQALLGSVLVSVVPSLRRNVSALDFRNPNNRI